MGHVCTGTHDYIRHGTLTLFAALSYLDGKVVSQTAARHTHVARLKFLKHIEYECPNDVVRDLIVDNYATRKHAEVRAWLARHPRFHMHFTPTSSTKMNVVECIFRDLTVDIVRHGRLTSFKELRHAITNNLAERHLNPIRYDWRADGANTLAKIMRAREKDGILVKRT